MAAVMMQPCLKLIDKRFKHSIAPSPTGQHINNLLGDEVGLFISLSSTNMDKIHYLSSIFQRALVGGTLIMDHAALS